MKTSILLPALLAAATLFAACENTITEEVSVLQADKLELTSGDESVAILRAEKSLDGTVRVVFTDMNGKLLGELPATAGNVR